MANQEGTSADQTVSSDFRDELATRSIVDLCRAEPGLSRMAALLERSGLADAGLNTVFVPADQAMTDLPAENDADEFLRHHMLAGAVTEAELRSSPSFKTLDGSVVSVLKDGRETRVGEARILRADLECTTGVVHVIDHRL